MHDRNDPQWDNGLPSAPPAPSGLRSTLPSQAAPHLTRTTPPAPPGLGQQQAHAQQSYAQPPAERWEQSEYGNHQAVQQSALRHGALEYGTADAEKRSKGVKNIVGGAVLIGIGFAFGGSVFLGNPDALDWIFDGLGTFWICKGFYEIFTA